MTNTNILLFALSVSVLHIKYQCHNPLVNKVSELETILAVLTRLDKNVFTLHNFFYLKTSLLRFVKIAVYCIVVF